MGGSTAEVESGLRSLAARVRPAFTQRRLRNCSELQLPCLKSADATVFLKLNALRQRLNRNELSSIIRGQRALPLLREERMTGCRKNKERKMSARSVLEVAGHRKVVGGLEGSSW